MSIADPYGSVGGRIQRGGLGALTRFSFQPASSGWRRLVKSLNQSPQLLLDEAGNQVIGHVSRFDLQASVSGWLDHKLKGHTSSFTT